jgi:hypothetical protein
MDKTKFHDRREWRKFGIGFGIVLSVIATIQLLIGRELFPYFYGAGIIILLSSAFVPVLIKPLFIIFSYIGFSIGYIMTKIILIVFFYAIITPIGVISRIFGKQFINIKFYNNVDSYWIDKKYEVGIQNIYENQF